jgi:hypothetical protein
MHECALYIKETYRANVHASATWSIFVCLFCETYTYKNLAKFGGS